MSRTTPVTAAPVALMAWERRITDRRPESSVAASSLFQCRTIPYCDSVKEVKTPTM